MNKVLTISYNPFNASSIVNAILQAINERENNKKTFTFNANENADVTEPVQYFNSIKNTITRKDSYFFYAQNCLLASYITDKATIDKNLSANLRSALIIVGSNLNNKKNLQSLIRLIKSNSKTALINYSNQGEVFIESNLYSAVVENDQVKASIIKAYNKGNDKLIDNER